MRILEMKKLLLATSCLALSSVAVMAADLPMQTKAPLMAAPVFSWTGCYVGASVGGGVSRTNVQNSEGISGPQGNGTGAIAGGQLGCNYQDGNWVFGLEGEGFWSGIKGTTVTSGNGLNGEGFRDSTTVQNTNDFTIAARAGIAFDRTFIYGKGGWAWGNYKVNGSDSVGVPAFFTSTSNQSGYLNGLLVGVGIEHALTRNWTIKAEYDYIAFGSRELAFNQCSPTLCVQTGTASISANQQMFKVGVNYLFDFGGAPLVAKY
jgi:outer membrane immunogenic protein